MLSLFKQEFINDLILLFALRLAGLWHLRPADPVAAAHGRPRQLVEAAIAPHAACARARHRAAAAAQQRRAQQEQGLLGHAVHRAGVHRRSRQPQWVPGGRAGQSFRM